MNGNALVSNQLNKMTGMFLNDQSNRRADDRAMAGLNMQSAQLDRERQNMLARNTLERAKLKRQQYMDEIVTGKQAIMTHPSIGEEQKAAMLKAFPDDILNLPFSRKQWAEGVRNAHGKWKSAMAEQARYDEKMKLEREKLGVMKEGYLSPSQQINQRKLQAWDSYMKGEASPEQQKMIGVDDDPYLARAAQMVVQDMNNFGKSSEDLAKMSIKLANVLRRARQQNPSPGPGGGDGPADDSIIEPPPGFVLDK